MKKLVVAVGALICLPLQAYTLDTDACMGTEYVYNESNKLEKYDPTVHTFITEASEIVYKGWQRIPPTIQNPYQRTHIIVENKSNQTVNFKFSPYHFSSNNGELVAGAGYQYLQKFSASNSPSSVAGAVMPSKTLGGIYFPFSSTSYFFSASMSWETTECLRSKPMMTTVRTVFDQNGQGFSEFYLNGGNAW
ncbi:hypothetical protein GV054_01465 [Marinomonas mediterranea]|jgi:hypothetical protein|uniref:Uncharacterized protein n=1 Tax=Marinomonas mediterranea (strain ATCC 700492 / JCM 21426 / NBRC 103028 / MMB-1) TaxID=717774 RepID=F2JXT8_MARM1|nr:hypothetical protein [Marinomonas mediterranea]ADZ89587.1 hypothetical protein Marme_0284 [Marinomonas mediterranea MMB-1]WCN11781.1 hypothetical protein GV054_01465 [Marinomonas mediterranea]WCN15829.1 hypothetical protein GV053_01430 [Marinomonas mediterranea MMB-1]